MKNTINDMFEEKQGFFYRVLSLFLQFVYFIFPATCLTFFDLHPVADFILFFVLSTAIYFLSAIRFADWIIWGIGLFICFAYMPVNEIYSYIYFGMFGVRIILFFVSLYFKKQANDSIDNYDTHILKNYGIKRKCFCSYILGSLDQLERMEGLNLSSFILEGNEKELIPVIEEVSNAFDILVSNHPYRQKGGFSTYPNQELTNPNKILHDLYEKLIYGNNIKSNRANRWRESTIYQFHICLFSIANIINTEYSAETKEMLDPLIEAYDHVVSIANEEATEDEQED